MQTRGANEEIKRRKMKIMKRRAHMRRRHGVSMLRLRETSRRRLKA